MEGISEGMALAGSGVLAAIVLLVLAVLMKGAAKTHTARRTVQLKRRARELAAECEGLAGELAEVTAEARRLGAEEKALMTEVMQTRKACAIAALDTFQVVHEVGGPGNGTVRTDVEIVLAASALAEGPAAAQVDPRVWAKRNVAQVWAPNQGEALLAAARAFPSRYGFVVTRVIGDEQPAALAGRDG